jgi:hypothetical protein
VGEKDIISPQTPKHSLLCLMGVAVAGTLLLLGLLLPHAAQALHASETVETRPEVVKANPVTAAQAIDDLNAQREANGIPGGLVEEPRLSEGCEQYTNGYVPASGQYPHTEIPGQPGYTELGSEAAASSDLSGSAGSWTSTVNPWTGAPLHLAALFDPLATTAWYGERSGAFTPTQSYSVCMGVDDTREVTGVSFYSLPGNGSVNVPFAEKSAEGPYTPAEAVGLQAGVATGPTIILWPVGLEGAPSSVTLQTTTGSPIAIDVATPETPSPKTPAGFPDIPTLGDYSRGASFVIPVHPLAAGTAYTLSVVWQPPTGPPVTQVVGFTTLKRYVGRLSFNTTHGNVVISANPAVGQTVTLQAEWGLKTCVEQRRPCPINGYRYDYNAVIKRVLRFTKPTVTAKLPRRPRGDNTLAVYVNMPEFNAHGQRWLANTLFTFTGLR